MTPNTNGQGTFATAHLKPMTHSFCRGLINYPPAITQSTTWTTGRKMGKCGFEPQTFRIWAGCSNQLSYLPVMYKMGLEPIFPKESCFWGNRVSQFRHLYVFSSEETRTLKPCGTRTLTWRVFQLRKRWLNQNKYIIFIYWKINLIFLRQN